MLKNFEKLKNLLHSSNLIYVNGLEVDSVRINDTFVDFECGDNWFRIPNNDLMNSEIVDNALVGSYNNGKIQYFNIEFNVSTPVNLGEHFN